MAEKSKNFKELEKKLGKQRKQKSEDLIKEKLNKKELDYDTVSLNSQRFLKNQNFNGRQGILMILIQDLLDSEANSCPKMKESV